MCYCLALTLPLHTDFQTSCLALAFAHLSLAPVVLVVFDSRRVTGRRGGLAPLPFARRPLSGLPRSRRRSPSDESLGS